MGRCALAFPVSCSFFYHGHSKAHLFSHWDSLALQTPLRVVCDPLWLCHSGMSFGPTLLFKDILECPLILSLRYTNYL